MATLNESTKKGLKRAMADGGDGNNLVDYLADPVFTTVDLNGTADALILDADADTTISAPTDDQIDIEVGGTDRLLIDSTGIVMNGTAVVDLAGGADALVLDADNDTTISAPTDDQIDIEVAGADDFRITANTFTALTGSTVAVADADLLTVGGVIAPQHLEVTYRQQPNGELADEAFFVANRAYEVVAVREIHSTAGTHSAAVNLQVTKDTGTEAPGAGADLLTNNTNAGFDLKGTANTVQSGTLTATTANLQLAAGDRLSVDFAGTLTSLAGVVLTVSLKRI